MGSSRRTRSARASTPPRRSEEKVLLWLSLAHLQNARLRAPLDAIVSLERERAPWIPFTLVAREQAANILESVADARKLREAVERP